MKVWPIKLIKFFLCFLFLLIVTPASGLVDKPLVKVNDDMILSSDLEQAVALLSPQAKESYQGEDGAKRLRDDLLEKLIEDSLFLQAAKKDKEIVVEEAEVESAVNELMKTYNSEEEFNKALTDAKLTPEKHRSMIKDQLFIQKYQEKKLGEKFPSVVVNVSEEEMKKFYEEVAPPRVHLYHLLLQAGKAEEEKQVKEKMEELKSRLKGIDSSQLLKVFSQLVKDNSQDIATRDKGGDLGWWEKGDFQPEYQELEKVVFSIKPGETAIVKTPPMDYHLILVQERQEATPYDQVKAEIFKVLKNRKTLDKLITESEAQDYFEKIRSQFPGQDFSSLKYAIKNELLVRKTLDKWITDDDARNYFEEHSTQYGGNSFEDVVYPIKYFLLAMGQLRAQAKITYY